VLPFLLSLLLAGTGPVAAGDPPKDGTTLSADAEARWIAFDLTPGNQILFQAVLNGRPVRALLDTGVTNTVATGDFATRARLSVVRRQKANAIGGGIDLAWAPGGTLVFGGLTRRGGRIGIMESPGQERFGTDLIVGSDVLSCCALDIDYAVRRFRIIPSGRLPFTGHTAPLRLQPGSSVPLTEVRLGNARLRPMIVDTGDGAAVTLSNTAWGSAGYRGATLTTTLGWGLGGPFVSEAAVIRDLNFAGIALPETELRIEGEGGYSVSVGTAGRIGTGLLLGYRVLLDPQAGRMVLLPNPGPAAPVQRSTSGLLLAVQDTHLVVLHVMRGSPAAETGWRKDETICQADGLPAYGNPVEWPVGTPGRTVKLTLCNGTERSLTLRKFY
jgi:hypothetical protein